MSQIIWKGLLLPDSSVASAVQTWRDESYQRSIENLRRVALANEEFTLQDPKAYRSMSRAALMLAHVCQDLGTVLKETLEKSPFDVGLYCAVENGPIDAPTTLQMIDTPPEELATRYRKLRNPKMYLKQLPNLVPAQLGIFYGLQGPMNVYTHSRWASVQALEQAEHDLKNGIVKMAVVCASHAFDDFLVVRRTRAHESRVISEAAAALVLKADGYFCSWSDLVEEDKTQYFGIADQIVNLVRKEI